MPKYIYTAKNRPHQIIQADIEAESRQDAVNKLIQMGYFPVSIYPASALVLDSKNRSPRFARFARKDIVVFTRQLASLVESGVNLLSGLNIIASQTPNRYLKAAVEDVIGNVKDGKPLSESLRAHPQLFPALYTALIHSAEVGGNLDQILKRLADFLEKEEEIRSSVRMSLAYPAFLILVSISTIVVLLGFIIPRIAVMFEDMGEILPLPTRILMDISSGLRNYWWLILLVIAVLIFFWQRLNSNPGGKFLLDRMRLKLPLIGVIALKNDLARLTHTLSLLLSSGIAIISALEIASSVVQNQVLKAEVEKFQGKIASGSSFSLCLGESRLFPALITNIVRVAEEAGNLEKALIRVAYDYEREVDRTLKALTQLLEPSIILVMGLIVGFIVISMLLPIFQINLTVK